MRWKGVTKELLEGRKNCNKCNKWGEDEKEKGKYSWKWRSKRVMKKEKKISGIKEGIEK